MYYMWYVVVVVVLTLAMYGWMMWITSPVPVVPLASSQLPKRVDILIPTVKRSPSYLDATLDSLSTFEEARIVIFSTAEDRPEHVPYECVTIPPIPIVELERALKYRTKTPTNEPAYLKWRTRQNFAVRYALSWVMTHDPAPHVIMLEDDVVASPQLMSFKPQKVACLRQGDVYCGAVAYLFEREFVWHVLEQLYKDGTTQPTDFIFERAAGGRHKVPRQHLVRHNGLVSSQPSHVLRWTKD